MWATHVSDIIQRSVLSDSDERGLVVRGRVDGREPVEALREAAGDVGGEDAVDGLVVHALEEHEVLRTWGTIAISDILNTDVSVPDNVTAVEVLRSDVVSDVRVGKCTRINNELIVKAWVNSRLLTQHSGCQSEPQN